MKSLSIEQLDLIRTARLYAQSAHENVNQKYDEKYDYIYHLDMAYQSAIKHVSKVFGENDSTNITNVLCAVYLHDTIEDCRLTYNDIRKAFNAEIADIVYALTNEKGKNREERANDKYYRGIRNTKGATFVKLCDRIANATYSKNTGSSMFEKYKKENDNFIEKLLRRQSSFIQLKYFDMEKELQDILFTQ